MKKTIAITSALAAASSLATAEIKINEFLSFEGFVDMSYSHTDIDFPGGSNSDNSFGIDQVEIDWLFNFGKVTAQVDLEYEEAGGDTNVEQAFVSYDLGNGSALTMGRYESMLGLEAKEPTGLYQFSTAYDFFNTIPQYAQGVKYTGQSGDLSYGVSIQDTINGNGAGSLGGTGDAGDDGSYGVEAAVSYTSGAITYAVGYATEDNDEDPDSDILSAHVVYSEGAWTLGAEYNMATFEEDGGPDTDVDSWLVMANYAYSDCCSVTGRISGVELEEGADDLDFLKYTLAHNYALTDNLAIITEVSYSDIDSSDGDDAEFLTGAVEVLFTF
jgi:predicted porin